jgi:hypothetical protein
VAGEVKYLCSAGHIAALTEEILAQDSGSGDVVAQSAWTTGTKTMLVINIRFSDQVNCADTETGLSNMMDAVNLFFITNSLRQTDMITTVTPCYTLTNTVQWYTTNDTSGYFLNVLQAARAVAANPTNWAGNEGLPAYNYLNYNLEAVRYSGPGGFSGQAYVGGRGCWLKSSSAGVAAHEFGHNYGNWHANRWDATNDTVTVAGTHVEYGNLFDTMGSASGSPLFFQRQLHARPGLDHRCQPLGVQHRRHQRPVPHHAARPRRQPVARHHARHRRRQLRRAGRHRPHLTATGSATCSNTRWVWTPASPPPAGRRRQSKAIILR